MPCCVIGARADLVQIEADLAAGTPYSAIESRYGLAHATLSRHNQHRQNAPAAAESPDDAVVDLLTTIRDALTTTYQEQIATSEQDLTTAQDRLAQVRQQLDAANAQAWQCAARVSQARELANYKPFKGPRSLTPRSYKEAHLEPYWDMLTNRQSALEQACATLDRLVFDHEQAAGGVYSRTQSVQRLQGELASHLERLQKPETLALAAELVQYTTALATASQQQQPQALVDHLQREVDRRRTALRTGKTP